MILDVMNDPWCHEKSSMSWAVLDVMNDLRRHVRSSMLLWMILDIMTLDVMNDHLSFTILDVMSDPRCHEPSSMLWMKLEVMNDSWRHERFLTSWTIFDFIDRKSTRLNSSHANISYAVFCLKKKKDSQYNFSREVYFYFNTKHSTSTHLNYSSQSQSTQPPSAS